MFDLTSQAAIPAYELKLRDGTVRQYDACLLAFELQVLEGVNDLGQIKTTINKVLEIDVDSYTALQILNDFTTFTATTLEEPLKNVFGREPS